MPSSLNVNGKQIMVPGVYGHIDTAALAGKQVSTGAVAIVGEFPAMEPLKPVTFAAAQQMRGFDPSDPVLMRLAQLLFSPATDDRVNGADTATLVNVQGSSQAAWTFQDADNQDALVLKAKKWGAKGNQVYVKLSPNTGSNKLLDIALVAAYGASESYGGVGSGDIIRFKFDSAVGTELVPAAPTSDTASISFGPSQILWQWKKAVYVAGNPIGKGVVYTFTGNKLPVSGILKASFDQAVPANVTATATATGLRADGTPVTATAVFPQNTNANSLVNFKVANVDVLWGRLDTVVWTTAGGDFNPNPPKFSIQAAAFDLTPSQFATVADIAAYLNNYAAKGWICTIPAPQAAAVPGNQLDAVTIQSTMNSDVFGRADLWAIVKALSDSGIVAASRAASSDNPPAPWGTGNTVEANLAGGADGNAATSTDYENGLAAILNEDVQIVTVFSTDVAMHKKLLQHCKDAPVTGAGERNGYVGCPSATLLADIKATYTAALNTRHLSVCAQNILRPHPVTGIQESLDPRYMAVQAMAMQAGTPVATPMTNKRPDVLGTEQKWTLRTDDNAVIAAGVYAITKDNIGYKVLRSITCWLTDDNPCNGEMSANESGNASVRRVRAQLQSKIGDPALNVTPGQFVGVVVDELNKQLTDNVIAAWRNVVLTPVADKYRVDYDYKPVFPLNFIDVWAHAYV